MKILFATDGSDGSREAAEKAIDLVQTERTEAVVVSIAPVPVPSDIPSLVGAPYVDYDILVEEANTEARKHAEGVSSMLEARGIKPRIEIRQGDAASSILELALQEKPDLLVVGSHGKSGLRRLLLGSVSQRVVTDSPCPVLVVRAASARPAPKA